MTGPDAARSVTGQRRAFRREYASELGRYRPLRQLDRAVPIRSTRVQPGPNARSAGPIMFSPHRLARGRHRSWLDGEQRLQTRRSADATRPTFGPISTGFLLKTMLLINGLRGSTGQQDIKSILSTTAEHHRPASSGHQGRLAVMHSRKTWPKVFSTLTPLTKPKHSFPRGLPDWRRCKTRMGSTSAWKSMN